MKMTRRTPPTIRSETASETLQERLARDLATTGGRMPICVVVADEAERGEAAAWLAGRRNARLLSVVTRAEHEAEVAKFRAAVR